MRACCRSLGTFVLRTLRGCRTGAQEQPVAAQQELLQVQATALPSPLTQLSGQPEQEGIQVQKFDRHSESEVISRRARSEAPTTRVVVSALRSPTVERRSGKRRAGKKCCLLNKLVKRVLGVSKYKNHLLPERTKGSD